MIFWLWEQRGEEEKLSRQTSPPPPPPLPPLPLPLEIFLFVKKITATEL
jgi:hypothetical protein